MSTGRHRQTRERRFPTLPAAVMTAPVMTVGAVGVGVVTTAEAAPTVSHGSVTADRAAQAAARADARASTSLIDGLRKQRVTRSTTDRAKAVPDTTVPEARLTRFATDALDIRRTPATDADVDTTIDSGTMVKSTGLREGRFVQVLWKGNVRWVTAQYLSEKRPPNDPATGPLSSAPCPDGSVENGLTAGAVKVYRAVCHAFPDITSYGGWDAHGEHSSGKAIDIMHPSVDEGYKIAEFLKAHAAELELYDVIWRQHIWTPVRASEGWRSMPDRGSPTANHFDHVHVSVN